MDSAGIRRTVSGKRRHGWASLKGSVDQMNRDQLSLILGKWFEPETYSLDGGLPNETLCLEQRSDGWTVYYSEHSARTNEVVFFDESDACDYMLSVMEQHPYMHRPENNRGK